MDTYPSVTVAIPAYNEEKHIGSVIQGFLDQKYTGLKEILIADGGSNDATREIVQKLSFHDPRIKLFSNPRKSQSYGLNILLEKATADIFVRADCHCIYSEDYIEKCVISLLSSNALNVGGAQRFVATNSFQLGICLASRSILGSGLAKYRNPKYSGYADTVFLGCFWRKDLIELRGYNEQSRTNEDTELNLRLLKKKPQAIYISSEIEVWYYPRSNPKNLWIQYFNYGRGCYITALIHRGKSPIRAKIPALVFYFLLFLSLFTAVKLGLLFITVVPLVVALVLMI